jgi:hypothetical protein
LGKKYKNVYIYLGLFGKFDRKKFTCRVKTEERAGACHDTPDTNETRDLKERQSSVYFPAICSAKCLFATGLVVQPTPDIFFSCSARAFLCYTKYIFIQDRASIS